MKDGLSRAGDGAIPCPNRYCKARLGTFNFEVGQQCVTCQQLVCPAYCFSRSKLKCSQQGEQAPPQWTAHRGKAYQTTLRNSSTNLGLGKSSFTELGLIVEERRRRSGAARSRISVGPRRGEGNTPRFAAKTPNLVRMSSQDHLQSNQRSSFQKN